MDYDNKSLLHSTVTHYKYFHTVIFTTMYLVITYDVRSSNALYYYAGMLESIIFIDVLVCFLIYMFIQQQIHLNLCTSTAIT